MLHDLIDQMVGHYRIIRPIEQGGMATVCLARDIHLHREVAVKVFQLQRDQEHTDEFFRRFTREAQIVARLDHPNILLVYDYGEQDSLAYLVMPYLARGSLKHLLKERGRLPIPEALHLIFQLLDALQYAHDRQLIHRDIKPGNILFKDGQTPVLADFGLVKEMATSTTGEMTAIGLSPDRQPLLTNGRIMGTPYYMAPEQIRGQVKPQSDIYSMGLVLYEMLTGQLPFTTEKQGGSFNIVLKQIYEPPRPIEELNPSISPQLAVAVMQALEKDIARRYRRPADFSQALRSALNADPLPTLEGPILLNRSTDDADSNDTIPVSLDLQLPIALASTGECLDIPSHTNKSSTDSSDGIVAATTHVLPRASGKLPKRRLLLYSGVLAAIVLTVLSFARPLFLLYSNNTSHHVVASAEFTEKTQSMQSPSTLPMPETQIACPQAGKARAAVLGSSPYQAQGHNAVVYTISSQDTKTGKESGTLMRYDVVTGKSSSIITVSNLLSNAQISGNGQWVIFSTYGYEPGTQLTEKPSQIQMVRIDGQGLQTLYCASSSEGSFQYVLASPGLDPTRNGWQLFFATDSFTMGILSITTGKILQKFSTHHSYQPLQWQSDDDLNLLDQGTSSQDRSSTQFSLVSLNAYDTLSPSNPRLPVDMGIPKSSFCSDLDLSPDLRTIFISQCQGSGSSSCGGCNPNEGPSTIDIMKQDPDTGSWSKASPIFTSSTLAIIQVRAITSSSLLFVAGNDDQYSNQNGIWKINTDGSGLQRLSTTKSDSTSLSGSPPWFNVARDGSMYAFKTGATQAVGVDQLFVGSLNGGPPTTIAEDGVGSINDAQLEIAGWITT